MRTSGPSGSVATKQLNSEGPDGASNAAAGGGTATRRHGAHRVARQALAFSHPASDAHTGFVSGAPAILVIPHARLATVITFAITNGKIVAIDVIADAQRLGQLNIESPSSPGRVDVDHVWRSIHHPRLR